MNTHDICLLREIKKIFPDDICLLREIKKIFPDDESYLEVCICLC